MYHVMFACDGLCALRRVLACLDVLRRAPACPPVLRPAPARSGLETRPARSGVSARAPASSGVLRRVHPRSGQLRRAPARPPALRRASTTTPRKAGEAGGDLPLGRWTRGPRARAALGTRSAPRRPTSRTEGRAAGLAERRGGSGLKEETEKWPAPGPRGERVRAARGEGRGAWRSSLARFSSSASTWTATRGCASATPPRRTSTGLDPLGLDPLARTGSASTSGRDPPRQASTGSASTRWRDPEQASGGWRWPAARLGERAPRRARPRPAGVTAPRRASTRLDGPGLDPLA